MKEKHVPQFILIDDDPVNNMLVGKLIKNQFPHAIICTFTEADSGLNYICGQYGDVQKDIVVLFLDINMPVVDGWEFLNSFIGLPKAMQQHFIIYMLSSSFATADVEKAESY
jgi:CheY-like chemotaxis protein